MKKLIIVMAILLTSCVEKRVESTNWVDIGGKPDVTINKVGNHQVLTSPLNRMAISIWLEYITEVELIW